MRHAAPLVARGLLVLLLSITTAWAQAVSTAQINGTVKDQGALALPGTINFLAAPADVIVTNITPPVPATLDATGVEAATELFSRRNHESSY